MSSRSRAAALIAAHAIAFGARPSAQVDRVASAETIALARLSEWFGPSDAVRPPAVAAPLFAAAGDMDVERLAVRAAATAYWRRVVAPAPAWFLDDLADYSADRIVSELFSRLAKRPGYAWPAPRYFGGFIPFVVQSSPMTRAPIASRGEWLATLEQRIGWPDMQAVMSAMRERGATTPVTASDLTAIATAVTGRDLHEFLHQVGPKLPVFDYGVDRLIVEPRGPRGFRSTVVVRRYGDGVFPVDVETRFAGGAIVTEHWDGAEPMWRFVYEAAAPAQSAEIDPGGVLQLDRRRANNRRTTAGQAIRRSLGWSAVWSGVWLTWLQDCLLTFAALA